ncbi:tripartite tricarboxylate transporter permease [Antarcticimicrobium sediminis]|uniref:tripartite tricarboxylate transporter permease n=1 Tax=Antarcticimicrobium sediminis TaxID=2546227 RepID=UPI001FDF765C|nr:tripartite tricarboxylate transporter permease [Antarcticimicrobium sediminis]
MAHFYAAVDILRVPFRWLAPGILVLAIIGSYAVRNLFIDVWVMCHIPGGNTAVF